MFGFGVQSFSCSARDVYASGCSMRRRAADIADFEIRTAAAHPIHPVRPHEPIRIPASSGHDSESRVIRIRSQGAANAIYKERRELIAVAMEAPGTQESYIPCAVGPSLIPTQARDAPSRYALQAHVIVGNLYLPIRKQTKGTQPSTYPDLALNLNLVFIDSSCVYYV